MVLPTDHFEQRIYERSRRSRLRRVTLLAPMLIVSHSLHTEGKDEMEVNGHTGERESLGLEFDKW